MRAGHGQLPRVRADAVLDHELADLIVYQRVGDRRCWDDRDGDRYQRGEAGTQKQ